MNARILSIVLTILSFTAGTFLLGFTLGGCGIDRQYENYPDLVRNFPTETAHLTPTNHPHGYGKANCFHCHVKNNIHQRDRVDIGDAILEMARSATKESECTVCHTNNGVTP